MIMNKFHNPSCTVVLAFLLGLPLMAHANELDQYLLLAQNDDASELVEADLTPVVSQLGDMERLAAIGRSRVAGSSMAVRRLRSRAITRLTFPSSTGTCSPRAMLAMAPAVYRPTPGSVCQSAAVAGRRPPRFSTTVLAARCRFRARV